jgi:hypothetical protein
MLQKLINQCWCGEPSPWLQMGQVSLLW